MSQLNKLQILETMRGIIIIFHINFLNIKGKRYNESYAILANKVYQKPTAMKTFNQYYDTSSRLVAKNTYAKYVHYKIFT